MRPIELTLDGFRSYHQPSTFRWEGRSLVGIVGPIGSGKTSLLDAISYALYAKTPRIEKKVRNLVGQRRDEGKVSLVFDVDGQRWRAVRSLRRSGQPGHALYRLDGDTEIEIADKAKDVTARVEELLGLDFGAFQRSVMLAQGEFDAFLRGTPAERDAVLRGVFDLSRLDRMRTLAQERLTSAGADLSALDELRGSLAPKQKQLAEATAQLEPAQARAAQLDGLLAAFDTLRGDEQRHMAAADAARARAARLATVSGEIPDPRVLDEVVGAARRSGDDIAAAARQVEEAVAAVAAAASAHAGVIERAGGTDGLERSGALLARLAAEEAQAAEAEERVRQAAAAAERAAQAAATADAAGADAERAAAAAGEAAVEIGAMAAEAEAALHEARHAEMATALRAGLEAGDPCPVCEQEVTRVPPVQAGRIDEAQALHDAAAEQRRAAESSVVAAEAALASARAERDGALQAQRTAQDAAEQAGQAEVAARERVEATRTELAGILGDGDPRALHEQRRQSVAEATAALEAARSAEQRARTAHDRAVAAGSESAAGLGSLARRLVRVATVLESDVEPSTDPESLEAAVSRLRTEWIDAAGDAESSATAADAEAAAARARRASMLEDAGLSADIDPHAAARDAAMTVARLTDRIAGLEQDLARLADLERRQAALVAERDRHQRLVDDLRPAQFPRYVLDERRRALADLGGDLFERLSAGRYRFTEDGEFDVVDLGAAERVRPADTLSGGETFLGSLALALALAETVAREGGRLDAFFLDEGFGSLDPEHLELAMDGVEQLVAMGDRLVVVVSHVEALRHRIDDLIVLDRDPVTGDTVVLSGAG